MRVGGGDGGRGWGETVHRQINFRKILGQFISNYPASPSLKSLPVYPGAPQLETTLLTILTEALFVLALVERGSRRWTGQVSPLTRPDKVGRLGARGEGQR